MNALKPEYQLLLEAARDDHPGGWRFILQTPENSQFIEAEDVEPDVRGDRLILLTAIRALEALDQPSRVTIHSSSVYLRQGVQFGISEWRANDWQWERFGEMAPVKNADLWKRIEHLLDFHTVEFRLRRFDPPHKAPLGNHYPSQLGREVKSSRVIFHARGSNAVRRRLASLRRHASGWLLMFRRRLAYRLLGVG
jgi:ribonuclease HI